MTLLLPFGRTLPNIAQSERAECGLACICMIAAYHGYDVDLLHPNRVGYLAMGNAIDPKLLVPAAAKR